LTSRIDPEDLILLNSSRQSGINESELKTPLLYTFHRQVVTVNESALANAGYIDKLNSLYDDIYLMSPVQHPPDGFVFVDSVRFKVLAFKHSHSFPHGLVPVSNVVLYLYRLDHMRIPAGTTVSLATWPDLLTRGWSLPEPWGVWSLGNQAVLGLDTDSLPDQGKGLVMALQAKVFLTPTHSVQRIEVSVNGTPVAHYKAIYPHTSLDMLIPIDERAIGSAKRVQIEFALPDAMSPQSLGLSTDSRQIAIGLISARFDPTPPTTQHGGT
jgi:hypothetical protein